MTCTKPGTSPPPQPLLLLLLLILALCQPTRTLPSLFHWTNQSAREDNDVTTQRNSKVLNFLSLPSTQECLSDDNRRSGVCQNAYECRMLQGESRGQCALGFGVCCVYTSTCGGSIANNVSYFVSPGFPGALAPGAREGSEECRLRVHKVAPEVSQLRLDMIHFTLGQPNRRTGVCEQDMFTLKAPNTSRELRMCGHNTGQHFYFDVEDVEDSVDILIKFARDHVSRFWEIKVTQVEFKDRAPDGCLQYHDQESGVVQTMNFADNGRHLADQDYNICIRQEEGMCSIMYEPCDQNSFKIGPPIPSTVLYNGGGGGGAGGSVGSPSVFPDPVDSDESQFVEQEGSGFSPFFRRQPLRPTKQNSLLCDDRIVMPCDSEDFIPESPQGPGVCDLLHCGNSFCSPDDGELGGVGPAACRIESSTLPFNIAVHFGPGLREENPEDNLGMCLRYTQQPCS